MSRFERFPEPSPPKKTRAWDVTDAAVLLGLGLIVAGLAVVSGPLALIVGGISVAGLAVLWPKKQ